MSQVDVIIPSYCRGRFLPDCVRSVLEQSSVDLRILILDDASPDDTPTIATELARQDSRITLRAHRENRGPMAIFNEGIEWVESTYSIQVGGDEQLWPGSLQRAMAVMQRDRSVALTYGRAIFTETPLKVVGQSSAGGSRIHPGWEWIAISCAVGAPLVPTPTALRRTHVLKQLLGSRNGIPFTTDLDLCLLLASRGSVALLDSEQAICRGHPEENLTCRQRLSQVKEAFDRLFREEDPAEKRKSLQLLARRRIAEEAGRLADLARARTNRSELEDLLAFAKEVDPGGPGDFEASWDAARSGVAGTAGLHPVEYHDGVLFRWTRDEATFSFRLPAGNYEVDIDTAGLRGPSGEYITGLWWNEQEVPMARVRHQDGHVTFAVTALPHPAGEQRLRVTAVPLDRPAGPDDRVLGTPVRTVHLRPHAGGRSRSPLNAYIKRSKRYIRG